MTVANDDLIVSVKIMMIMAAVSFSFSVSLCLPHNLAELQLV